jgi:protein HOOK3
VDRLVVRVRAQRVSDLNAICLTKRTFSDSEYFHPPSDTPPDNWVLRFTGLKRLYRLMTQYLSDALGQPAGAFDVPALQEMAKEGDLSATLLMCRLAVTIAIRCENNAEVIQKIQDLPTADQGALMEAMQKVCNEYESLGDVLSSMDR